jgi:DNA-binding transcriptional MerR regulator
MKRVIFVKNEVLEQTQLAEGMLQEWEKLRLIKPDGLTSGQVPFYTVQTFEKIAHLKKMEDLGYKLEDIQKIIKKVGFPKTGKNLNKKANADEFLTVGALAERVHVSPRAIKYWEDMGIIEPDMRSEGGFRLYSEIYVYLCKLVKDLQLFGYSLEEIKVISNLFRDFVAIHNNLNVYSREENARKLDEMLKKIQLLFEKMKLLKEGTDRWEDLLKKKKKEVMNLKEQNQKRAGKNERKKNE